MQPSGDPSFGDVLRRLRVGAGLTQEELAERAGMSARAIGYLEHGSRKPYPDTVRRLAAALQLPPPQMATLAVAAHNPAPAAASAGEAPLRAATNLPIPLSSFIGRAHEGEAIRALLTLSPREGGCRLVTLAGTGGCGKTRLALETGHDLLATFPDGVWLVSLAAVPAATLPDLRPVLGALADALSIREQPGRPIGETIGEFVRPKRILLLLDNCEHLLGAAAALAATLLATAPSLRILATSRQRLGITGETVRLVTPLSSPPADAGVAAGAAIDEETLASLRRYEAVQLFEQRAQAQRAGFALTGENARAICLICSHLDGLPLALELAAARMGSLGLDALAARLDQRLLLLAHGDPTAPQRQHTFYATVDWSYGLLDADEQRALLHLSVFAGGHSLEAAEWVLQRAGADSYVEAPLDLLTALVEKHLIYLDDRSATIRYRMLALVRHYARTQLEAGGLYGEAQRLQLSWCLELADAGIPGLVGPAYLQWMERFTAEQDTLRAALRWSLREGGDPAGGMRLAVALWPFWDYRGYYSEGRAWLEEAMQACPAAPAALRARALIGAGTLALRQVEYGDAAHFYESARALCLSTGDGEGLALALEGLGRLMQQTRTDPSQARTLLTESLRLYRELDHRVGIMHTTRELGVVAQACSDYATAAELYRESLRVAREVGDRRTIGQALSQLGAVARAHSRYGEARELQQEALAMLEAIGDRRNAAHALGGLGSIAEIQGRHAAIAEMFERGLSIHRELGNHRGIADALASLGIAAFHLGDDARARASLEESLALRAARADSPGMPHGLAALGDIALAHGDVEEAGGRYAESLILWRQNGHRWGLARALERLGRVACLQGEWTLAARRFRESLSIQRELHHRLGEIECWEGLALVDTATGAADRAVRRLAAAAAARRALGAPISPRLAPPYDRALDVARRHLGERPFQIAWAAGLSMAPDDAAPEWEGLEQPEEQTKRSSELPVLP